MASHDEIQIIDVVQLAALVTTRPALLGATKLILIDGPAGSGKSTLAKLLAQELGAAVIHMDDLYHGWEDALTASTFTRIGSQILEPLISGTSASYQKFDWIKYQFSEWVEVNPAILIIEGVGAASKEIRNYSSMTIWIEVEPNLGMQRVLQRDGNQISSQMANWQLEEASWHQLDETKTAAEMILLGDSQSELSRDQYYAKIK
jgi:uridine kinase